MAPLIAPFMKPLNLASVHKRPALVFSPLDTSTGGVKTTLWNVSDRCDASTHEVATG